MCVSLLVSYLYYYICMQFVSDCIFAIVLCVPTSCYLLCICDLVCHYTYMIK